MEFMVLALTLGKIAKPRLRGFLSVPAAVHGVDGGTLHRTVGSLATAIPSGVARYTPIAR